MEDDSQLEQLQDFADACREGVENIISEIDDLNRLSNRAKVVVDAFTRKVTKDDYAPSGEWVGAIANFYSGYVAAYEAKEIFLQKASSILFREGVPKRSLFRGTLEDYEKETAAYAQEASAVEGKGRFLCDETRSMLIAVVQEIFEVIPPDDVGLRTEAKNILNVVSAPLRPNLKSNNDAPSQPFTPGDGPK